MSRTAKAARLLLANVCESQLIDMADACVLDAKDANVGPILAPLALAEFFHALARKFGNRPVLTAELDALAIRLQPLLSTLSRSGIQQSDRFNHEVDDFLIGNRDLLP